MPNSSSLNSITSADSGYSSHEQKSEKVCRGAGKKEQRVFKTLLQNLSLLEFSDFDDKKERQFIIFKNYLDNHVSKRSKEIKEELHFATVDLAIREVFCSTVLPHNQGCAFLSILKSCSHKEIIEKVLEIYQIENQKSALCLLKKYIDKDGYNALHCLADLLVKKVELEVIIQPKD